LETEKLSISLPRDMARMIRQRVEDGAYASNSEVIREAIRLWQQEQARTAQLASIRHRLAEAADDSEDMTDEELARHLETRLSRMTNKPPS
jgi:antitoxin ParD1/3/4